MSEGSDRAISEHGPDDARTRSHVGLWRHRELVRTLTTRELSARYRGSILGIAWSLVTPLAMLVVYTFVFGTVLKARSWNVDASGESLPSFALVLFSGLIMFWLASDVLSVAPALIRRNVNFVKRVVFPLQILPLVSLLGALVQATISMGVLIVASFVIGSPISPMALLVPLVIAPYLVMLLGLGWFLAAFGTYLRDLDHIVPPLMSAILFLGAVFYPLAALPSWAQTVMMWTNPIVVPIVELRRLLFAGTFPDWTTLGTYSLVALAVAYLGHLAFQLVRRGFADVV